MGMVLDQNLVNKLGSNILQLFAKTVLVIRPAYFYDVLLEYADVLKQEHDFKEWSSITKLMNELNTGLSFGELNVISFCNRNSGFVSDMAHKPSTAISSANNTIFKNFRKKLLRLYR
ncbi:uncharacterized protein EV154DRAFT_488464 [Mucor mucedo]|uniref:uncharacterized protein n=1 Tax=Mucor mucedo TaxID=29922 RepID=UPI00221FAC2F|nr:uncharacterized protein EV154DRAFT_488464 [Mucor mucedo]KAI7866913.1 hypothetical protein EV154DRAFT_488464 [Mucor mucedo]